MLVPATTLITAAKRHADAMDPNAGAWLDTATWQEWLDDVYTVLYDRLLFSGALVPDTVDTDFTYDPAVGYMNLAYATCRVIVDVFRVFGGRYEPLAGAQHTLQFPNLDLQNTNPWVWGSYLGQRPDGVPGRSWSAFLTPTGTIHVKVSPHDKADSYRVRTIPDPDTSGGYVMPAEGKQWVALCMARRAQASEGVYNQATVQLHKEAEDDLKAYLESFQLRQSRKVSMAPYGPGTGSWNPGGWWWRA